MPTTTNYGWTIPADTDLVKNGALAIRTLGNEIDTTAAAQFNSGFVKINTTTFTAQSSVSVNNVFSSTYDNYRLLINNLTVATGTANVNFRLRKAGTDNSSSIYIKQYVDLNSTTIAAARPTDTAFLVALCSTTTNNAFAEFNLFNPNNASIITGITGGFLYNGNNITYQPYIGIHNLASSADFDGFSLIPSSSTISGTITTYGLKK